MAEVSAYAADVAAAASAALPWGRLSGSNILVTGATGLIGGCLVDVLMARPGRDYRVFAAGRNAARAQRRFARYAADGGFSFVHYDVSDKPAFATDFHYIIHAAGGASPAAFAASPVEVMRANFNGTDNLLSYGMAHGLRRFLYVSSGEVYGQGDGSKPFSEGDSGYVDCATARACYPSAKRAAETLCASYAAEHGADVVIARPCHTYGPHFTEADNRVYAQFIRNVLRGEDSVMKSDGSQVRSWCYVADCACALLHILLKGGSGMAYNVADPSFDITAVESVRVNVSTDGQQSRAVNFDISITIRNSLDNLEISFDLAAPEDLAMQNELNSLTAEQRANQAMGLLVYNTYSGPGTTAKVATGNPLNAFLQQELNRWAQNSLKGVDLSFGIDSYGESDPGGQHTDYSYRLSKNLFGNRVRAVIGGSFSTDADPTQNLRENIIGDVSLEYMLDKRDNMFIKLFRHTGYESILEGEITETGVGFVIRKRLLRFTDLFRLTKRRLEKQQKDNESAATSR